MLTSHLPSSFPVLRAADRDERMTFQIYVGGVRVNSDFITNTAAWGGGNGQQVRARKQIKKMN